jgi:hypothetical protein
VTSSTPKTYKELSNKKLSRAKKKKQRVKHTGRVQFGGGTIVVPEVVKHQILYAFKLKRLGFVGSHLDWDLPRRIVSGSSITDSEARQVLQSFVELYYEAYPLYKFWRNDNRPTSTFWKMQREIVDWQILGGNSGFRWILGYFGIIG